MSILDGIDSMTDNPDGHLKIHPLSNMTVDEERYMVWKCCLMEKLERDFFPQISLFSNPFRSVSKHIDKLSAQGRGERRSTHDHDTPHIVSGDGMEYLKKFDTFYRDVRDLFPTLLRKITDPFDTHYLSSFTEKEIKTICDYANGRVKAMLNNKPEPAVFKECVHALYNYYFPEIEKLVGLAHPRNMHAWLLGQKYFNKPLKLDDGSEVLQYTALDLGKSGYYVALYLAKDPYGNNVVYGWNDRENDYFNRAPRFTFGTLEDFVNGKISSDAEKALQDMRFHREEFDVLIEPVAETFEKHWSNGFNTLLKEMEYLDTPVVEKKEPVITQQPKL